MTRTARRRGKRQALSASTWTELKVEHINQDRSDDAVKLHRVKKNGLKLTKKAKLTSSLMPTKQLLKKLKKKTGKKVLGTQDDLMPMLQASESEEEVIGRVLGSVSIKEHRKPKKEKLSKQKKKSIFEKKLVLHPDSDDHHEGSEEDNASDQEPTEKSTLLKRKQRKRLRRKCMHKKRENSSEDRIPLLQSDSDDSDAVDGEDHPKEQQPKKKKPNVVERDGDSLPGSMASKQSSGTRQKKKGKQKANVKIEEMEENLLKRREARRLRRQKAKVCFNCRQPGHQFNRCPQGTATGMCFKCGSSDHMSKNCKSKIPEGKYPYAKCFICGEVGHLSKACPDNPRGLYPQGGGCRVCGSVEHKQTDCPEKQRKKTEASLVITNKSADAEDFGETKSVTRRSHGRPTPSKHKVVMF